MFCMPRIILDQLRTASLSNHFSKLLLTSDNYRINVSKNHHKTYSILRSLRTENKKEISAYVENDRGETLTFKAIRPKSSEMTQLLVSAKSKKNRYSKQLILIEGKRLIVEALQAKLIPVKIVFSRRNLVEGLPLNVAYGTPNKTVLYQIPYNDLKLWSDLTTSPGIFGIFKMPNLEKKRAPVDKLPITIVCDNVREPGNLGSILRIAAGIPVEKVILVNGCTDLWDPKVIRSSSGAMFYLNVVINASWEEVDDNCKGKVLLADHLYHRKPTSALLLSEDVDKISDTYDEFNDDIESSENVRDDYRLPVKSCFDNHIDSTEPLIIVVGGETYGLSENAFQLASSRNGYRVNIPLSNCINSLNTGAALGIISFELKRQLMSNSPFNSETSGED